jgi:hypothetical protein
MSIPQLKSVSRPVDYDVPTQLVSPTQAAEKEEEAGVDSSSVTTSAFGVKLKKSTQRPADCEYNFETRRDRALR